MVRAPCCEKMGLKKGPWTPEEDHILVTFIQSYGHGNWRALPKQAGLLRCGKSCRLRWTNYLRPDIKRGNFTSEEEDMIISLHQTLGNRWSAIAARLPGRTDNEIKNVWHTLLKKRLISDNSAQEAPKKKARLAKSTAGMDCKPQVNPADQPHPRVDACGLQAVSPAQSFSDDLCSSGIESCQVSSGGEDNHATVGKEEWMEFYPDFPEIDESFWSEELSMENGTAHSDSAEVGLQSYSSSDDNDNDDDFWLRVFMESGNLQQLPGF